MRRQLFALGLMAGRVPVERVRELALKAELRLLPCDRDHPSGSHPDECAEATLRFLQALR